MKDATQTAEEGLFINGFRALARRHHRAMQEKGFWDDPRNQGELIALMHSELSEALEAARHNNPPDDKIPQFTGLEAELADVILRIMDFASAYNSHVAEAVVAKMEYNLSRARKHGKEF